VRLSDVNLHDRVVIAADGLVIGEIAALFLDAEGWRIEALQIKLRPEIADRLGAERHLFRAGNLEVPVTLVQSVSDTVVLSVPVDGLRQVLNPRADAATV
jgi:sporulation protein YlmC with PRC-barrel domain